MAENYKLLYEQMKKMLEMYQDEIVPNLRKELDNRVEVVRCKACMYCDPENRHCDHPQGTHVPIGRKPDDFCSYGERREGG